MSTVIAFPGKQRPTFTCLDAGRDGYFVLHTDEDKQQNAFGPFLDVTIAREFAANISDMGGGRIKIDWSTFPRPYQPDPSNGEVYVTELIQWSVAGGIEVETPAGFGIVHMSSSGDSADVKGGFATLAEAQAGALRRATECNAVLS